MREIKLSNLNKFFKIDDEDFDNVNQFKWRGCKDINHIYVEKSPTKSDSFRKLHRFLLKVTDKNVVVDHIDRNTLNNQKSNLRICTRQQNSWNSNSEGVQYEIRRNRKSFWRARITVKGKTINLGYFLTKEKAMEARKNAKKQYFGQFA